MLTQGEMQALAGISDTYWRVLCATLTGADYEALPRPVDLPGQRLRYRRADVMRWIHGLRTREHAGNAPNI